MTANSATNMLEQKQKANLDNAEKIFEVERRLKKNRGAMSWVRM